jgi:hypothetical protein
MKRFAVAALVAAVCLPRLYAPPPLITGDVPTADFGTFELYTGFRYQDTGRIQRQLPHVELVYGFAGRWEVSAEANYLSRAGAHGIDDFTLATKTVVVAEGTSTPALGASYEFKFDNGDAERGLGSGGYEHDLRLRAQKTFGSVTPILNFGYVLVPDAHIAGRTVPRQDVWRASFAQEWQASKVLKLLSEVYWRTADEPGDAARLGWNVGFKHKLRDGLTWHGAIGESLRASNAGGPDLRVYLGVKFEFPAPWRKRHSRRLLRASFVNSGAPDVP